MEAPENIYVSQHSGLHFYKKQNDNDIEYTRTDAFIEKACKFFAPYIQDNSGGYDRAFIIDNFKKYMKGE